MTMPATNQYREGVGKTRVCERFSDASKRAGFVRSRGSKASAKSSRYSSNRECLFDFIRPSNLHSSPRRSRFAPGEAEVKQGLHTVRISVGHARKRMGVSIQ